MYWSLKSKYLLVDKTGLDEPKVDKTHYKNTWVTFINYSFRLSQLHISVTKECHQIGFYWKGFFFIYISLRRPICLYTFLAFLPQTMQPRNSGHADVCKIKATTHLTRNADYKFSEKLYYLKQKEGSVSTTLYSNCKQNQTSQISSAAPALCCRWLRVRAGARECTSCPFFFPLVL